MRVILSFSLIQEGWLSVSGSCQFLASEWHKYWLNTCRNKHTQEKCGKVN